MNFLRKNKEIFWFTGFAVVGLFYFGLKFFTSEYHTVHFVFDDKIPFIPLFIVPYVIWYLYVPIPMIYMFFKDKKQFLFQAVTLFSGALFCCLIFIVYPTKIDFRPTAEGEGFLLWLCRLIYRNDTPSSNVFPSLHCYEALVIHLTTFKTGFLKNKRGLRIASAVLMTLICFSTVFVKQHSFVDAISGCLLAFISYYLFDFLLNKRGLFNGKIDNETI